MLADMSHRYNGNYERVGGRDVDGIRRHQSAKSYHLIQSFSPDDHVTPEEAHAIGVQLMRELLGNDYQFVIATHVDKDHIHNHIVFNAYSMTTLKKFRSQPYITANRIKEISNRLTAEHGLSVSLRRDEQLEKMALFTRRMFTNHSARSCVADCDLLRLVQHHRKCLTSYVNS
ncbi:relaxase [Lacticaseibacillus paracasei]|nr:relaxase [Lacticaseibacillus paracasei]